jgi:RpiR family carbohydrate utilization transcriptional regulator
MGVDTYFAFDFELQLINTSRLSQGDVLVAISYSGKTKTIVDIVKHARNLGVKVIAITNYPLSPLAKNADIVLLTASFAENIRAK